ncbi:uncharacterized protein [Bombus fervidus]|uniref:uncharacterized protein n=1 Tax=Bombus fervidus TaxID=203811 RepID=UPI003AB8EFE3
MLRNRNKIVATSLARAAVTSSASSDFVQYTTPEENQHLYKRLLLDLASRAPKRERFLSRVSSFDKSKQAEIEYKRARVDRPMIEETPRREISVRRSRNFDKSSNSSSNSVRCGVVNAAILSSASSYGLVIDELKRRTPTHVEPLASNDPTPCSSLQLSPCVLYQTVLVGEALKLSPMKRRRVIVSKKHKRNSIVRRAVQRRRSKHARRSASAGRTKSFGYLGSPNSESVSLIENYSVCRASDTTTDTASTRISRSMDDIAMKIDKTISSPSRLIRTKNFADNKDRWKDENENNLCNIQYSNKLAVQMPGTTLESRVNNNLDTFQQLRFTNSALEFYSTSVRDKDAASIESSIKQECDDMPSIATEEKQTVLTKRKRQKRIWKFW